MKHGVPPASQLVEDNRLGKFGEKSRDTRKVFTELGTGDLSTDHSVLSVYTQSFREILSNFSDDIRHLSLMKKSAQTVSTDTIHELGLKIKSKMESQVEMDYNKDNHAALRDSWKTRLNQKLNEYNVEDMPVQKLYVELNNDDINHQIRNFMFSEAGKKIFPERYQEFNDYDEGVIGLFYASKARDDVDRHRWSEHSRNSDMLLKKGFKKMTLDLRVLLPKRDFLSVHEKGRIYFVDWTQEDIHDRRSLRDIVNAVKRSIEFRDEDAVNYCRTKSFKVDENQELTYVEGKKVVGGE